MKKRNIVTSVFILLLVLFISLKFIPFGTAKYTSKQTGIILEIPRLYIPDKENNGSISFMSLSNKNILEKELYSMRKKYTETKCHSIEYYYDEKNDITIKEYEIESGFILNKFSINYYKGKLSNDECNKITDFKKIEYKMYLPSDNHRPPMKVWYKYLNKNGNKYNVYTDCNGCLYIKKGMGYYGTMEEMLYSDYLSMHDFIDYLEYETKKGNATKKTYNDGGSVIYKIKDLGLLKCNTTNGNQDIYISNEELRYTDNYCK